MQVKMSIHNFHQSETILLTTKSLFKKINESYHLLNAFQNSLVLALHLFLLRL